MIIVQKYGGTSVASLEKISAIAKELKELSKNFKLVVVVSAMGKKTNELLAKANSLDEKANGRELDALLSTGEIETASLLALALSKEGIKAKSLSGRQAGIYTNSSHNKAYIEKIDCKKLYEHLKDSDVLVVAGFQGIDSTGNITTLGRGGSDTTAVAIASVLNAPCEIYTDVAGIHTINPKDFKKAKTLKSANYDQIISLAFSGAKVIDIRAIEIAKKYNTPVFVGQSLEKDKSKGTFIFSSPLDQNTFLEAKKQNAQKDKQNCIKQSHSNKKAQILHLTKQKGILKRKKSLVYANIFAYLIDGVLHNLQKILLKNCKKCDFYCSKPHFWHSNKNIDSKNYHFKKQANKSFSAIDNGFESPVITGIATKNIRQITIQTNKQKEFFNKVCEKSLFLEMFSNKEKTLSFACTEDDFESIKQTFASFAPTTSKALLKITLVGNALATHPQIVANIFSALEKADVKVISSELSDLALSIVINPKNKSLAIKSLCQELDL